MNTPNSPFFIFAEEAAARRKYCQTRFESPEQQGLEMVELAIKSREYWIALEMVKYTPQAGREELRSRITALQAEAETSARIIRVVSPMHEKYAGQPCTLEGYYPRYVIGKCDGQDFNCSFDEFIHGGIVTSSGFPAVDELEYAIIEQPRTEDNPAPKDNYWIARTNPRLRMEDGTLIWGDQCWWAAVQDDEHPSQEVLEESLEQTLECLRMVAAALFDGEQSDE